MRLKIFSMIAVVIFAVSLLGCTSIVKSGTLDFDKSISIGKAFDTYKYFKKVEWKYFVNDNRREIVEVVGTVDFDKHPEGNAWKNNGTVNYFV